MIPYSQLKHSNHNVFSKYYLFGAFKKFLIWHIFFVCSTAPPIYSSCKVNVSNTRNAAPETCVFDREIALLPSFIKVCMHNIYTQDASFPLSISVFPHSALSRASSHILLISAWCCYNCSLFLSWFVTMTQNGCNTDESSDSSHWDPNLVWLVWLMCLGTTLMKGLKL